MFKQFQPRFSALLGVLLLLLSFHFDSGSKVGTALSLGCAPTLSLAALQERNPRASAARICGRPRGMSPRVRFFLVKWSTGAILTDEEDRSVFLHVASYADAFFEVDPVAPAMSVKEMPEKFHVTCAKQLSCDEVVAQLELEPVPTELPSEPQEEQLATRLDARWIGQSAHTQYPRPTHPNPVHVAQGKARDRAIKRAWAIGYTFGSTISGIESALETLHSNCSRLADDLRDNPDVLAAWQKKIAQKLNDIPLPPEYADPELQGLSVGAFSSGFEEGFGDKKLQFMALNATATVSIVIFTSAFAVVETATAKALRLAVDRVRTVPVYVPAMTNGAGFFLKIPKPAPANVNGPAVPVVTPPSGFGNLSRAAQFGILTEGKMAKAIAGTGLERHHLFEQRFVIFMDGDPRMKLTVAVTAAEHQEFTNAWKKAIPYGEKGTHIADRAQIIAAARKIYTQYPAILQALDL